MNNFSMKDYKFNVPYFDNAEDHHVKTDFWMMGNIAMSLMDLFYGINKEVNHMTFVDDFVKLLKDAENDNHRLKAEMEKHPRFQRFAPKEEI